MYQLHNDGYICMYSFLREFFKRVQNVTIQGNGKYLVECALNLLLSECSPFEIYSFTENYFRNTLERFLFETKWS